MRNLSKPMSRNYSEIFTDDDLAFLYRKHVGQEMKAHRVKVGMTQEKLAEALGVTGSAISGMELGRVTLPAERYDEIAIQLGIDKQRWGKFLLRYSNPWIYALIYGQNAADLTANIDTTPERTIVARY